MITNSSSSLKVDTSSPTSTNNLPPHFPVCGLPNMLATSTDYLQAPLSVVSVTADHSTKKPKATPSKRAAGTEDRGEPETPTKKPRAPRKKESKSATPEDDEDMGDGVKKEELDEV